MTLFDLVLQTRGSLHPDGEPDGFISEYLGFVHAQAEGGTARRVGKVHAYRIHADLAARHGEPLSDVCDAHSHALHACHSLFYEPDGYHFRDPFGAVECDCLVVDYVVLHPRWRGLRLGLLACHPDLAAELEKLRLPYNVDGMAQALALEALKKPAALEKRRKEILAERTRLEAGFARLPGLKLYPGAANFLFVRHPKALEFHGYLLKRGIRVRSFGGGISDCLRITVGKRHENALLLKAAHSFFKERA